MRGWVLCLVSACYAPSPPLGAPCGEREACPAGQFCVQGRCSSSGSGPDIDASSTMQDANVVDSVTPADAPTDTPPVPPVLRFGDRTGAIADTLFDTFLDGDVNNVGEHPDLHVTANDSGPVLIRFDITDVPTYATVTSARLSLYVSSETFPSGTDIDVFLMNESWTEGTGNYSPGIANANERNAGQAWSTSGARSPSRSAAAISTTSVPADLAPGGELSITIPPATVQAWIANPATNHGIALVVNEASGFYAEVRSTEAGEADERPMLELMLE